MDSGSEDSSSFYDSEDFENAIEGDPNNNNNEDNDNKTYSINFPVASRFLGVNGCQHIKYAKVDKICPLCTPCVICNLPINNKYKTVSNRYNNVYCHKDCLSNNDTESLVITAESANFSFLMSKRMKICHICKFVTNEGILINSEQPINQQSEKEEDQKKEDQKKEDDRLVSIHSRCIQSQTCYVCGQYNRPSDLENILLGMSPSDGNDKREFTLDGTYIRHNNCIVPPCMFCNKMGNVKVAFTSPDSSVFKNNLNPATSVVKSFLTATIPLFQRSFYHEECLVKQPCERCKTTGGNIKYDGTTVRHIDGCTSQQCISCKNIIGSFKYKDFGNDILCHLQCLKCSNCKVTHGEFTYVDGFIIHNEDCSSKFCPTCNLVIGTAEKNELEDGNEYHRECLDNYVCFVCGEQGRGKKIKQRLLFRHKKCSPEVCEDCKKYMGRGTIRQINDKIYHGPDIPGLGNGIGCGPRCNTCNKCSPDDGLTLKLLPSGKYQHTTCINDNCVICSKPLGDPSTLVNKKGINEEMISIHKSCSSNCARCGVLTVNHSKFKRSLTEANKKLIPRQIKGTALILYGLLKRKKTVIVGYNSDGKQIKNNIATVPRELREFIVMEWLHNGFKSEIDNLPLIGNSFDLRLICTKDRCSRENLCPCGDILCWTTSISLQGCQKYRCSNVINSLRDIMTIVLKKDIAIYWPETDEKGFEQVEKEMLKILSSKLSTEKLLLYSVKMPLIAKILAKRQTAPKFISK